MNEQGPDETFNNIEEQTESLTPGARVVIRSKDIGGHAFQGRAGVLIELPDDSSQLSKIHLDRTLEAAYVLVLVEHLELEEEANEFTKYGLERQYKPLGSARIGHETWDEARDAGRYNRALTLTYSINDTEYRVTLHATVS